MTMIPLPQSEHALTHNLEPHFEALKSYTSLKTLQASPLYQEHRSEIERVTQGIAWCNTISTSQTPQYIRVVAWNIERGLKIDGIIHLLKTHPVLNKADILLITEADIGMGRTNNRNIPKEISDALNMNYVFANSFLALEKGDIGEQHHTQPNTLSLHGICIFSKFPIQAYQSVPLPVFGDIFNDYEKRLGCRKSLICTIPIGQQTIDFAVTHIELATSARQRGIQMHTFLQALSKSTADGVLIGGDFNTMTYNLRSKKHLFASLFFKIFFGLNGVLRHYMTPEIYFEKPLFKALLEHGFDHTAFNDRTQGTLYYNMDDPITEAKLRQYRIPNFVLNFISRKLAKYKGRVPLHLDWFAGKNVHVVTQPTNDYGPPQIIDTPHHQEQPVSDHSPIIVDLKISETLKAVKRQT